MTIKEKLFVAAIARDLIVRLKFCEDSDFVDFIIKSVKCADTKSLEPENLLTK